MTRRTEIVMGIPFTIEVPGGARATVLDEAFADLRMVDRTFSPFLPESAVSRINDGALRAEDAGPLVVEVIGLCRSYAVPTGGWFSAWASGRFDPCGLVKGWAIDRACAVLERAGDRAYFVDGAGDVRTRGERAPGSPWRVGLRHPVRHDAVTEVIAVSDRAVATSGTYERGPHILDPHTRRPADQLLSITVVGPDIVDADVFATAAFAMGIAGVSFVEAIAGYEAYAIDRALHAAETSGFAQYRTASGASGVTDGPSRGDARPSRRPVADAIMQP